MLNIRASGDSNGVKVDIYIRAFGIENRSVDIVVEFKIEGDGKRIQQPGHRLYSS